MSHALHVNMGMVMGMGMGMGMANAAANSQGSSVLLSPFQTGRDLQKFLINRGA